MNTEKGMIDWASILAELEAKKAALEQSIAGIRASMTLGVLGGAVGDVPAPAISSSLGSASSAPVELPAGAFLGKSLPASVKLYLSAARSKRTIKEIAQGLREGGIESTSPNFEGVVTGSLNRLKAAGEVLRFKDGWGLAEWYPPGFRGSPAVADKKGKKNGKKRSQKKTKTAPRQASPVKQQESTLEPETKVPSESVEARVVDALRKDPANAFDANTLAGLLGVRIQTLHLVLGKIVSRGIAAKTEAGTYQFRNVH
jgi:hypothetical protein